MPSIRTIAESLRKSREAEEQRNSEAAKLRDENSRLKLENQLLRILLGSIGMISQAKAAKLVGVDRGLITRAVQAKEIESNGETGRDCLIDPESLVNYALKHRKRSAARKGAATRRRLGKLAGG